MYWDRRGGVVALILVYFSHVYKHGDVAGDWGVAVRNSRDR